MGIETTRDLFIYELGLLHEFEGSGKSALALMAHNVNDGRLKGIVQTESQECVTRQDNITASMKALGSGSTMAVKSDTAKGVYGRFETFLRLRPSPAIADQFAADTIIRFLYLGIAAHKTLVDWAILMGECECAQYLHTNLIQQGQSVANLESFSHELGIKLLGARLPVPGISV
ncbi:ferritin-like domain-containing protein [Micromonospora zamorensis]|uniref:Ferritin-like domain-containing protein n=1 Tax=Micromonospora zamorensis TaxID=709883 RepID=A0ABZ1PHU1_9ACTN|nr:ferritin-like domain-containing protein [Micromonospora zamorensis]